MIDINKPIRIYDDTDKDKDYIYVKEINHHHKEIILVTLENESYIVIHTTTGSIFSSGYRFYYAENYIP